MTNVRAVTIPHEKLFVDAEITDMVMSLLKDKQVTATTRENPELELHGTVVEYKGEHIFTTGTKSFKKFQLHEIKQGW